MLYSIIQHIKEQLQQPNCYNIPALRAQLQVAETEYSMMTKSEEERKQLRTRRAYNNWLHNNPSAPRSLVDVCSTNAGEGGGSSAKVCGIDSASSRVDVCNTNDKGAVTPADGENSSGNKPGFGRTYTFYISLFCSRTYLCLFWRAAKTSCPSFTIWP